MHKRKQVIAAYWIVSGITEDKKKKTFTFYAVWKDGDKEVEETRKVFVNKNKAELEEHHKEWVNSILDKKVDPPVLARKQKSPVKRGKKPTDNYGKYIKEMIELLKAGLSNPAVYEIIRQKRLTETGIDTPNATLVSMRTEAQNAVNKEFSKERVDIVTLHTARYNQRIKELVNIDDIIGGDEENYMKRKIAALHELMDTMFQKERILGIHKRSFVIQVNNDISYEKKERNVISTLDLTNLTLLEQIQLLELLEQAKIREFEPLDAIIANASNEVEETEDVEAEVVQEQVNIDKITHTDITLVKNKMTNKASNMFELQAKMKASLLKAAKKTLKDKGANLDQVEEDI